MFGRIDWGPGATILACTAVVIGLIGTVAVPAVKALGYVSASWLEVVAVAGAFTVLYWLGSAGLAAGRAQSREKAQEIEPILRPRTLHRTYDKFGRNEDCPCGSGRKVKRCHVELSR